MTVKRTIEHTPVPVRIWTEDVTHDAVQQLEHVAHLPFVYPYVAAMPDVHPGIGATVGSVIPTRDAIVPAAVGVDIGCGMIAARLSIDATTLPDSLCTLRSLCPGARLGAGLCLCSTCALWSQSTAGGSWLPRRRMRRAGQYASAKGGGRS